MGHLQLKLKQNSLRKEILDEIIKETRLIHCSICGAELEKADCKQNSLSNQNMKKCKSCEIMWIIELKEWANERGDGMVVDSGRYLILMGYCNCYCRQSILEHGAVYLDSKHPRNYFPSDPANPQESAKFNYLYPIEVMGHVPMPREFPHWMLLAESFIREKSLPTSDYGAAIEKISNVTCPFCKSGVLKIVKVKPVHSGGHSEFSSKHHVGNELEYGCSNEKCDAKFEGRVQWMYID